MAIGVLYRGDDKPGLFQVAPLTHSHCAGEVRVTVCGCYVESAAPLVMAVITLVPLWHLECSILNNGCNYLCAFVMF